MTNDLPSWVSEYDEEYEQNNKKRKSFLIIGSSLIIISFLILFLTGSIEYLAKFRIVSFIVAFIGVGIYTYSSFIKKSHISHKYLASMLYFIGHTLEKNSDIQSRIYVDKMNKHIKNCDAIINTINKSLIEAIYVKNTSNYAKKLNSLIKLLNEFYINHQEYDIDKADIAQQIIQLADLIHDDNGYITDKHITLIDLLSGNLIDDGVVEKTLYISKNENFLSAFKTISSGIPYTFKLVVYIALIIFIAYNLISYVALSKGISQDTAFGMALTGSIAALVPALMVRDQIIK